MYILGFVTLVSFYPCLCFTFLAKISHSNLQIYTYARQRNTKREKNGVFLRRKALAGKKCYRRIRGPIPRILTPSPGLYSQGIKSYKGIEFPDCILTSQPEINKYTDTKVSISYVRQRSLPTPIKAHKRPPYGPIDSSSAPTKAPLHSSRPQTRHIKPIFGT